MSCGRIRPEIKKGWTQIIDNELQYLKVGTIKLEKGETYQFDTKDREYACILISGKCNVVLESGLNGVLGPRANPFEEAPYGVLITRDENVRIEAEEATFIGAASAPAEKKVKNTIITPKEIGGGKRGSDNWQREVRFVCWTDNTEGNCLIAGETVTPSGNWSTIPPHRHQYDIPGEEVPYEEVYLYQFSKPQGFGIIWQFDDEGKMDQAFSLKTNDAAYMSEGYHPAVCGPGSTLYHITFIAGPYRMSKSSIHKDYRYLLEEKNMENPFAKQFVKK